MPSLRGRSGRPTSAEHQAAVARRLDLLRAELSGRPVGAADEAWEPTADGDPPWWSSATRVPDRRLSVVTPGTPEPLDVPGPPHPPEHIFGPPPWVPVPGRHASRRARALADWVPDTLHGRVSLGPTQVAVVAVLVAIGLAVTAWTVVRSRAEPVAPLATSTAALSPTTSSEQLVQLPVPTTPAAAGSGTGAPAAGGSVAATVTVDVAGKVRRPGIAVLDPGARVVDALEAAGGARSGVDLASLNLARPLVDGEQILVGVRLPPGVAASALASDPSGPMTAGGPGTLVNLNSSTEADLDTLPEVGPVTAQSIIAWREEHGGFTSVDELLEVDGIGDATLTRIAPFVTV